MPIRIDAAFQRAEDITLDAFRAPAGAQGEFRDMVIEVDGRAFRVSFADPNDPRVRFAEYDLLKGLFYGSRRAAVLNRLKDLVARHSIARDLGEVAAATGFRENLKRTIRAEKGAIAQKAGGKFALYGFSAIRDPSLRLVNQMVAEGEEDGAVRTSICSQLINGYNEAIGLKGSDESAALTIAFVRDNDRRTWEYSEARDDDSITRKDRADWARFLRWRDLDIFSKIRRARSDATAGKRTGWAGEVVRHGLTAAVHDMVRKNTDPRVIKEFPDVNVVTGAVADSIVEIVDTDFGDLDIRGIEAKIAEIVARHAPEDKAPLARRILDHVAMTAFWRQTSKLGLDFFKSRGETVVFEWTTLDGKRTDGAELADKWWKDGETDVADHMGAPITNSEMRHLGSAKYAAKIGSGRVVRIEGALSAEDAGRIAAAQVERFAALDRGTLDRIAEDLEAGLDLMDAQTLRDLAADALANLPLDARDDYLDSHDSVSDPALMDALCARAFGRLRARIDAAPSAVVKAALLAGAADVFQAEILKDPEIVGNVERSRRFFRDSIRAGVPGPLVLRQLSGVERGLGGTAFFSPRTGRPNELGACLLNAGGDVMAQVGRLRRAFAGRFGIAEADALAHPAFRAFIPRVAREAKGSLDRVIAAMDDVFAAHEAKEAVMAHLRGRVPLLPDEQRIFIRRGEWDLDRLVYNEVKQARRQNRPADLDRLRRNGEVICEICARTRAFVREFARRVNPNDAPGLRLTEEETVRLENAYLDRLRSPVNEYRLQGKEKFTRDFDGEDEAALLQASRLCIELQEWAGACRRGAQALRGLAVEFGRRLRLGMPLAHPAPRNRTGEAGAAEPAQPQDPEEARRRREERERREAGRIRELEARAAELEARAGLLTDERLRSLVIHAVATCGKRLHAMAALRLYRTMKAAGPLPTDIGETPKERIRNLMDALADRIRDTWLRTLEEEARVGEEVGHDDGDKAIVTAFALYLKETPEVKAFLDREVEDGVAAEISAELTARMDEIPEGDPILYVADAVLSHGKL